MRSTTARDATITHTWPVRGMHCASCAQRVQKALADRPGVTRAGVNLATERATVECALETDVADLARAVHDTGYELDLSSGHDHGIDIRGEDGRTRAALRDCLIAAVLTVPIVVLAMFGPAEPHGHGPVVWSAWIQLALATPVQFWAGRRFLVSALAQARHGSTNMDTLVAIGTLAAFGYSVYSVIFGGEIYFETAAVIITFLLLGKYLEHRSKARASEAITGLLDLAAKEALVVRDGVERLVPIDQVVVGDVVRVRPGAKLPADGLVKEGHSAIDQSMLTGEWVPVEASPGDAVYAATINTSGSLLVEVMGTGSDTALARIARLVEDAQNRKAPVEHLADRVAGVFVPVVIAIASVTFGAWLLSGHTLEQSLVSTIAVLIIACPCAMGLATPAAVMVGTGRGAQLGIIIKGGDVLEQSGNVTDVVFDKTGTLTHGVMSLTDVVAEPDMKEEELLRLIAALESPSEHPVARAIVAGAEERGLALPPADRFESIAGAGVRGIIKGRDLMAGREDFVRGESSANPSRALMDSVRELAAAGRTVVWVAEGGRVLGVLGISDVVKPTARSAVQRLHELGLGTMMITGDGLAPARAIADQVGIDRVIAGVMPEQKVEEIRKVKAEGRRVAMVGDGINDSPALAEADLGVAIGTGADVAIEAGDLTLVSGDPLLAVAAVELSRRTLKIIKQNLFWAFAYNVAAIPLAAFGVLDPMIAAAAMALSSVSVVTNALRLRSFRPLNA
jgi:heavy metal translocating P-type ATPase